MKPSSRRLGNFGAAIDRGLQGGLIHCSHKRCASRDSKWAGRDVEAAVACPAGPAASSGSASLKAPLFAQYLKLQSSPLKKLQAGRYAEAAAGYSAGLAASSGDAGVEAALYCNRAACGAALGRPAEAAADACAALALEPGYLRALQRRAEALAALGEHAAAAQARPVSNPSTELCMRPCFGS